jgi:HlyD family secretion protein
MRSKRRPIGWIILAIIVVVALGFFLKAKFTKKPEPKISTAKAFYGTVTASVSGNGTLQPVSTVQVKSNVGGQVVELLVDEGDTVKAGQLIARIDDADPRSALQQVEADMTSASSRVRSARENLDLQRSQTATSVAAAEQALAQAKLRLAQAEGLATMQNTSSTSAVRQAEEALTAARARLAQAETQAKTQPRLTQTAIKQAEASLASAQAALQQTKTSLSPQKLAAAQASHEQAQANHAYAEKDLDRQRQLLAKGFVAKSAVDAAQQRFDVARAQLATARNKFDTVKDEVKDDLAAAQARVDQADAALDTAKTNSIQDDLKAQDVNSARAAMKQAEAALTNAQSGKGQDTVKAQDVAAARAAVKQSEANLTAARASAAQIRMRLQDITQAEAQARRTAASVTNARTQLNYTAIYAPRDGVVVMKYAEVGSIVTAGRASIGGTGAGVALVDIADVTKMRISVDVDETDISKIALGQNVDITVDAYPNELFSGVVKTIAPQAVTTSSVTTIPVTVQLDWTDTRLKPGMNATCDFVTERKKHALLVPSEALKETDDGNTVQILRGTELVTVPVQVGIAGVDNTEIVSGVKEGELVVTAIEESTTAANSRSRGIFGGPGGRRR